MIGVHLAGIRVFILVKAEYHRHFIGGNVVGIQSVLHHKGKNIAVLALINRQILVRNADDNFVVYINIRLFLQNTVHGAVVIEQVNTVRGITEPVVLFHIEVGGLFAGASAYHIVSGNDRRLGGNFRNLENRGSDLLHFQIAPGYLI